MLKRMAATTSLSAAASRMELNEGWLTISNNGKRINVMITEPQRADSQMKGPVLMPSGWRYNVNTR